MDNEERIIEREEEHDRLVAVIMPEPDALITIQQLPVIKQNLLSVKERWQKVAADAKKMVATDETVQVLKKTKAAINAEYKEIDQQRLEKKAIYMGPWNEIEATFKDCIKNPKDEAISSLDQTIKDFESEIVQKTREKLVAHFQEMCTLEQIDFLTFDQAMELAGIKRISLTDAKKRDPKQLKDSLSATIARIAVGMEQIRAMDDSAEIMVEFKKCLDAGQAVAIVQERRRRVREAAEAEERRKAEAERQKEMAAKVAAAAEVPPMPPTPVAPPEPVRAPTAASQALEPMTDTPIVYWKKMSFTIYFRNPGEYEKVLPTLRQLKEILNQEEIPYGK